MPHARDELGISNMLSARPVQAALASAGTFALGAVMPLLTAVVVPGTYLIPIVAGTSLVFLTLLGRYGCVRWWRKRDERRCTCHILGGTGDGTDRRRRGAVRYGCVRVSIRMRRPRDCKTSLRKENVPVRKMVLRIVDASSGISGH